MDSGQWRDLLAQIADTERASAKALQKLNASMVRNRKAAGTKDADEDAAYLEHERLSERLDELVALAMTTTAPDTDALRWKISRLKSYYEADDLPSFAERALPSVLEDMERFLPPPSACPNC